MVEQRYFLSTDVDGHWYIVPENKKSEWVAWCCLPEDDPKAWDAPDFATRVGGSPTLVTFTNPKIR